MEPPSQEPSQAMFDIMHVQSNIKIYLMRHGVDQGHADMFAGDIMNECLTSSLVKDEHKEYYAGMDSSDN